MKRQGPIGHGLLLCGALFLGYTTWTRDTTVKVTRGEVTIWSGSPSDVKAVRLENDGRKTRVERRSGDKGDTYLWGVVVRQPPAPKPKEGEPPEALLSSADAPPAPPATTKEFPIGESGGSLIEKVAPLKGLRELGPLDDAKKVDYGLNEIKDTLIVELASGETRELAIGGRVFGGNDRYVIEKATGKGWVIPGEVIQPLEGAETSLRETKLHAWKDDEIGQVVLKAGAKTRAVTRRPSSAPAVPPPPGPHGEPPIATAAWSDVATPDKVDQTIGNFMDRVGKLTALEYSSTPVEGLTPVVAFEYKDKGGKVIGATELWKKPGAKEGEFEYWLRSERTRVHAKVSRPAAERVDQDLAQLLGP